MGQDQAAREGKRRAVAAAAAKEGLALVYPFTPCPNHRCSQSTSKQLKKSRQLLYPTPPRDLAQFSGVSMDLSVFPAEALEFSAWTEQQWQGRLEELAARSPGCFQVQPFPSTRLRGFVW